MDSKNLEKIEPCPSSTASKQEDHCNDNRDELPEGGWGWMVVVGIFVISVVINRALGVFFVEWKQYFNASATEISWVVSLPPAVLGILSPVAGGLCMKFGSRKVALVGSTLSMLGMLLGSLSRTVTHLYISVGLVGASGSALMFTPSLVMLGDYFKKRYVLANSIALCGFSFSQVLIPILAQFLIEMYGWRGAMLILAAVGAHSFPCAILLRPRRRHSTSDVLTGKDTEVTCGENTDSYVYASSMQQTRDVWTSTTSLQMFDDDTVISKSTTELHPTVAHQAVVSCKAENNKLRRVQNAVTDGTCLNLGLLATLCGTLFAGIGFFVTLNHIVARAVDAGISRNNAALLVMVLGVGNLIGRAGHGVLIDRQLVNRDMVFITAFVITALMSYLNPFLDTFSTLCVFSVIYGMGNGVVSSLMFAMIRLQVSAAHAPLALSFGMLIFAVSGMAGGVIAGWLFDKTGNYDVSFYFAGASLTIGTMFVLISFLVTRRKQTQEGQMNDI